MTDTALFADVEKRTIRGLLLPFDEMSSPSVSNTAPVMFSAGTVTLPADPVVVVANEGHSQFEHRGHAVSLEETAAGIVAEFAIARTPEGDALLAAAANPDKSKRPRLSAEVAEFVRSGARAVSSRLTGGAFVPRGAFASAALFALSDVEAKSSSSYEYTDEDGVTWRRVETSQTSTEETENGETTTTVTTVTTEEEPPAEEAEEKENEVTNATVPATMEAGAGSRPEALGKTGLFEAIVNARQTGDRSLVEQLDTSRTGLFALNDIKVSGAGQVGTGVIQPAWVGELWSGRRFQRKVIPLIGSEALTSLEVKGYRWGVKPQVAEWAGNKADVPTNTPTTTSYSVGIQRFAGGHDIAREFVDFGVTEVLEAYTRHMVDSYAIKSDAYALAQLVAAAGAGTAAEVYPIMNNQQQVSTAVGRIIQGALQVAANDAIPAWAIVAPDMYKLLAYTPKDAVSEFLSQSLNLDEREGQVGFRVLSHTGLAAGQVLVGAKESATALELPGSPIRVNALDIARGGVDEALFGYIGVKVDYPQGLALIKNAA